MIILSERKHMNFNTNLKKIRIEKGMTQMQLAEACGVTSQAISNYEMGIREPNLKTLKKQADVLEVTVDELLEDEHDEGRIGCQTEGADSRG